MSKILDFEEKVLERLPPRQMAGRLLAIPARRRLELLLDRSDAAEVVAALSEQDYYLFVQELGGESALPLLALAKMEQLNHIGDLEWWQRDHIQPGKALVWCEAFRAASESKFLEWFHQADFELLVLLFKNWITAAQIPEGYEFDDVRDQLPRHTLDHQYFYEVRYPQYEELLNFMFMYLFEVHHSFYAALMGHVLMSMDSEFEELAYQFHRGRLEDNAIPDFQEAGLIYNVLPAERVTARKSSFLHLDDEEETVPTFALTLLPKKGLFFEALAAIEDEALLKNLQFEIAALANKVMVADLLAPDEPGNLRQAVEKTAAYVNLGLEILTQANLAQALIAVRGVFLEDLFRLGHTRLNVSCNRLKDLVKNGWLSRWPHQLQLLDEDWFEAASLLLAQTPMLIRNAGNTGGSREEDFIRGLNDLRQIEDFVVMLSAVGPLFEALDLSRADWSILYPQGQIHTSETVTLGSLLLTAAARFLWQGRWEAEPLPVTAWPEIFPLLPPARLEEALERRCREILAETAAMQQATRYMAPIFKKYAEEMASASVSSPPDPRLVQHFLFTA